MMKSATPTFTALRPDSDQPVLDLSAAPLPTPKTLRRRRSLPAQLVRFGSFNLRILRIVISSEH